MLYWMNKYKYLLLFGFAALIYLPLMEGMNAWTDEIFSMQLFAYSWKEMFHLIITEDGHPPLFYTLLRVWMSGTDFHNMAWARLFSCFWIFALALLGPFPVKRLWGAQMGFWFCALALFMPVSLYLGTEARMYAMALFFIAASSLYACLILRENKKSDWVLFFIYALAGMYTHYLATLYIGMIYFVLFCALILKYKSYNPIFIRYFLTAVLTAILFAPWLFVFLGQANHMHDDWYPVMATTYHFFIHAIIPFENLFGIQGIYFFPMVAFCSGLMLFLFFLFLSNTLFQAKNTPQKELLCQLLIAVLTFAVALILSFIIRPILAPRYFYFFLIPVYFILAYMLSFEKRLVPVFMLAFITLGGMSYYARAQALSDPMRFYLQNQIRTTVPKDATLICNSIASCFNLIFYVPEYKRLFHPEKEELYILRDLLNQDKQNRLANLTNHPIYFVGDQNDRDKCSTMLLYDTYCNHNAAICFMPLSTQEAYEIINTPTKAQFDHETK